ncbi:MAG TPA: DNA-formamidopyrimidine glycosylase family protein [Acidimicrobiales bacterium]|nr:DNA-formamidopyrimidine glycosylase family protein [Acidimicrobiales bacterium]
MPEVLEVERYRELAEGVVGRPVAKVVVPDPHCLADPTTQAGLRRALVGVPFERARRHGKLLLLDQPGVSLGLRFGMTGGLLVDEELAIDRLIYAPAEIGEQWIRFRLYFADGGQLSLHDPRRFGRVQLDPDESRLGPDVLSLTEGDLRTALAVRAGPGPALKARLLDQSKLAGVGNLLADEILWRADLAPDRPCASLDRTEERRLHRVMQRTLAELTERGGSHMGDLMDERHPGGHCPRDGTELVRTVVGGRTTFWCPGHQR